MNQDFDKEIESILRRASRRSAKSPSSDASANSPHMDADELSAYAEGALPDAARTRYMSHLADCDSCRKIVTELVVSEGIEREKGGQVAQTVEARTGSWREWLAALFSPPVLRYAVPALVIFAVVAVVFIATTRNGNAPSFVAQNEPNKEQQSARPAEESKATANTTSTATTANVEDNHENNPAANANSVASNPATPPATLREASPAAPTVQEGAAGTPAAPKTADLSTDDRKAAANEQQRADESKRAEPPAQANAPTDSVDRMKEKDDATLAAQRKQQSADSALGGGSAAGATNGRRARGAEPSTSTTAPSEIASEERTKNEAARKAPSALGRSTARDSAGDDESSATRTVAGRRFRQRNGIWVDTSYNSSRSLTKVRRDSEQYRALVADEPVIATVANTLGNVIVVIKGRAYHVY